MKFDMKAAKILMDITDSNVNDCLKALEQSDNDIDKSIEWLKSNNKLSDDKASQLLSERNNQIPLRCPNCGSQSIELMKRGWKLTTGFLGSGKNQRVCKNCLYKW